MDGRATRWFLSVALIGAIAPGALAIAGADPTTDPVPPPASTTEQPAAHADVIADQGGVSLDTPDPDPTPTKAETSASAPESVPAPPAQTDDQPKTKSKNEPASAQNAGSTTDATVDRGAWDEVKRGAGEAGSGGGDVSVEQGAEAAAGQGPVAPSRALPAREELPLGPPPDADKNALGLSARSPIGGLGVMRTIGAVVVVVLMIVLARVILARVARMGAGGGAGVRAQLGAAGRAPSGIVQILGRYPVARGQSLVLMKLDRRVLLLSQTGSGFNTLSEITDAEEVASILSKSRDEEGESLSARFGALLRRLERDPGMAGTDDIEIAPYLNRPSLDEVDGFDTALAGADQPEPEAEDPGEALRRRLEGLRGLSA